MKKMYNSYRCNGLVRRMKHSVHNSIGGVLYEGKSRQSSNVEAAKALLFGNILAKISIL